MSERAKGGYNKVGYWNLGPSVYDLRSHLAEYMFGIIKAAVDKSGGEIELKHGWVVWIDEHVDSIHISKDDVGDIAATPYFWGETSFITCYFVGKEGWSIGEKDYKFKITGDIETDINNYLDFAEKLPKSRKKWERK